MSWTLRLGPLVSWIPMALIVSLKWWLLLPAHLPFVHVCAVCMGRVHTFWCPCASDVFWTVPYPCFHPGEKVMADDEFTQDLFRFLQLLCEGHNNGEEERRVRWRGGQGLGWVWKGCLS